MVTPWPKKTREIRSHHFDSTVWNDFRFRDGDIVIATYAKSGTTWMQQIVAQLVFDGSPEVAVADLSPWVDLRVPARTAKLAALEAQTHRRFVKTHLPVDALVFSPRAKYIYVGRDGRDVVWSLHNHHVTANADWYATLNDTPGLIGPPMPTPDPSVTAYFRDWLARDGFPFWPFWDSVASWWNARRLPNVCLVHFADLKQDLAGEIRRIAAFLDIPIRETRWPDILRHCSFEYMKRHGTRIVPMNGAFWQSGSESFMHHGTNDRWRAALPVADSRDYERAAICTLGAQCARWLRSGMHGTRRGAATEAPATTREV